MSKTAEKADPTTKSGRPYVGTKAAAVLAKNELDDYLKNKKLEKLFSSLAADLLVNKPKHPITHMCRVLKKIYPKQFAMALDDLPDEFSDEEEDGVVRTRLPMTPNERAEDDRKIEEARIKAEAEED
jgi:hypothetical protein